MDEEGFAPSIAERRAALQAGGLASAQHVRARVERERERERVGREGARSGVVSLEVKYLTGVLRPTE